MTFWDDLLVLANRNPRLRRPIVRMDLWETAEKTLTLEVVVQGLAEELERVKKELQQAQASAQRDIDKLRLQVDVLQSHETRRRSG